MDIIRKNLKRTDYLALLEQLFDICSCTCPIVTCEVSRCCVDHCEEIHIQCKCVIKVPKRELKFLIDQRNEQKMYIKTIDRTLEQHEKDNYLKNTQLENMQQIEAQEQFAQFDNEGNIEMMVVNDEEVLSLEEYVPPLDKSLIEPSTNRIRLPKLAEACYRYCVSNRAGAAIANGVLADYGIITEQDYV